MLPQAGQAGLCHDMMNRAPAAHRPTRSGHTSSQLQLSAQFDDRGDWDRRCFSEHSQIAISRNQTIDLGRHG